MADGDKSKVSRLLDKTREVSPQNKNKNTDQPKEQPVHKTPRPDINKEGTFSESEGGKVRVDTKLSGGQPPTDPPDPSDFDDGK